MRSTQRQLQTLVRRHGASASLLALYVIRSVRLLTKTHPR
jgi:hypothetical protein